MIKSRWLLAAAKLGYLRLSSVHDLDHVIGTRVSAASTAMDDPIATSGIAIATVAEAVIAMMIGDVTTTLSGMAGVSAAIMDTNATQEVGRGSDILVETTVALREDATIRDVIEAYLPAIADADRKIPNIHTSRHNKITVFKIDVNTSNRQKLHTYMTE